MGGPRIAVVLTLAAGVLASASNVAQAATPPANSTPTGGSGSPPSGPVLGWSHTEQIFFVASAVGFFALFWFILIFQDRRATNRWRKKEYSSLLRLLVTAAGPRSSDPALSVEEVGALAKAINQPTKGAQGLTRTVVALGLITLVAIALAGLLVGNSANAGDLLKTVVTSLTTALTMILGFYFGAKAVDDAHAAPSRPSPSPKPADTATKREDPPAASAKPVDTPPNVAFALVFAIVAAGIMRRRDRKRQHLA